MARAARRGPRIAGRSVAGGVLLFLGGALVGTIGAAAGPDQAPCVALPLPAPDPPAAFETPSEHEPLAPAPQLDTTGASTLQQTIGVTIRGGGLRVPEPTATIELVPSPSDPRTLEGALPPVTVVDARGTHEGWQLEWEVEHLDAVGGMIAPEAVTLEPAPVEVVHGLPTGAPPAPSCPGTGPMASVPPGGGGGTYQVGAGVTIDLDPDQTVDRAEVVLRFSVG